MHHDVWTSGNYTQFARKAQQSWITCCSMWRRLSQYSALTFQVGFLGGSARLTTRTPRVSYLLGSEFWFWTSAWGFSLCHELPLDVQWVHRHCPRLCLKVLHGKCSYHPVCMKSGRKSDLTRTCQFQGYPSLLNGTDGLRTKSWHSYSSPHWSNIGDLTNHLEAINALWRGRIIS